MPCWCLTLRVFINTSRGKKARSCCLSFSDKGHKKIEPSLKVHLAFVVECLLGCCNLHLLAGRCVCNHICVIRIAAHSLLLAHLARDAAGCKKQVKEKKRLYRKIPQSADIDRFLPIKQLDRLVKLTGIKYQLIWGDSNAVTKRYYYENGTTQIMIRV